MNGLEEKLICLLKDIRKHNVLAVKTEFEAEGASFNEAMKLKNVAHEAGIHLITIKISGCEAVNDLCEAKKIGANIIVAPLVETPFALKKYIKAIKTVFSEKERKRLQFFINIETITGYRNLDDIISSAEFDELSGVILGRSDMAESMGLQHDMVNGDELLNIARNISSKMEKMGKEFFIGGGISAQAIKFLREIPYLTGFVTRKIMFDLRRVNILDNIEYVFEVLLKAIEFEILWIKNKKELGGNVLSEDKNRLKMLKIRYNDLVEGLNYYKLRRIVSV